MADGTAWTDHWSVERGAAVSAARLYLGKDGSGVWKFSTDPADADGYLQEDGNSVNKINVGATTGKKILRVRGTLRIEA